MSPSSSLPLNLACLVTALPVSCQPGAQVPPKSPRGQNYSRTAHSEKWHGLSSWANEFKSKETTDPDGPPLGYVSQLSNCWVSTCLTRSTRLQIYRVSRCKRKNSWGGIWLVSGEFQEIKTFHSSEPRFPVNLGLGDLRLFQAGKRARLIINLKHTITGAQNIFDT